jgi:hypothetical protein
MRPFCSYGPHRMNDHPRLVVGMLMERKEGIVILNIAGIRAMRNRV